MKKLLLLLVVSIAGSSFSERRAAADGGQPEMPSPHLVISQFQGGGSVAEDEFVEIHNTSSSPVDLNGYRLIYRSANGSNDVTNPFAAWTSSTIIPPGGFYLVASTSYDGSVPANLTYSPTACSCSMRRTALMWTVI